MAATSTPGRTGIMPKLPKVSIPNFRCPNFWKINEFCNAGATRSGAEDDTEAAISTARETGTLP